MNGAIRDRLNALKFRPHGDVGAMRAVMDDVEFVGVDHPLAGVALTATCVRRRHAGHLECFFARDATVEDIAALMVHMFEQVCSRRSNAAR